MMTQTSIGKLFLAGFIPGILQAGMFMSVILIMCWRNPKLGPSGPSTTRMEKLSSLKNTWIVVVLFFLVIGGIYFGWFTPTEGAAIGAFGAFLFALGRRQLGWKQFKNSLLSATKTTGMIFFIILGALMFSYFLAVTRLPTHLAELMAGLESAHILYGASLLFYIYSSGLSWMK